MITNKPTMEQKSWTPFNFGMVNHGNVACGTFQPTVIAGSNNHLHHTMIAAPLPIKERIEFGVSDPVESFTGRDDIIAQLHRTLQTNKSKDELSVLSQITVVSGAGGVGKTEVIRKYVHAYKSHYGHTLWVNAETFSETKSCFIQIAASCQVDHKSMDKDPAARRQAIEAVYDFVCRKPCLIIFDNAESMGSTTGEDGIRPFLPQAINTAWKKPVIVVTSRSRDWNQVTLIELPGLAPQDCYNLLRSQLKFGDAEDNRSLSNQIRTLCEGLPLVLQQVIAIIQGENEDRVAVGQPPFTMKDFLSRRAVDGKNYASNKPADSPLGASAFEIYSTSLKKLEAKENGDLALRILGIMAVLKPDNIPTHLLTSLVKYEPTKVPKALNMLHKQNLVTRCNGFYRIHRVTQLVAKSIMKNSATRFPNEVRPGFSVPNILWIAESFENYLSRDMPRNVTSVYAILENGVRLASQFKEGSQDRTAQKFLEILANKLLKYGKSSEAEMLFQAALKNTAQHCVAEACRIKCSLALACSQQEQKEKYTYAISIYTDVIRVQQQTFGIMDSTVYATKNFLANAYANQGNHNAAVELYEDILKFHRDRSSGPAQSQVLTVKHNLANSLRVQGKYDEAAELYKDVLRNRQLKFGPTHWQVLTTKHRLANCFVDQSRYDDAVRLFQEIVQARETILGSDHPDTLDAKQSFGYALTKQGKLAAAIEMYENILKVREANLGPTHRSTISSKYYLAVAYSDGKKYDKAEELYIDVLKIRVASLGMRHPKTLNTKNNLAYVVGQQGRYDQALEMIEDVLKHRTETLGPAHLDTLTTITALAEMHANKGQLEKSANVYKEVLEVLEVIPGPMDRLTLTTRFKLANVLRDSAIKIYKDVVKSQEAVLGPDHPDTIATKRVLENACRGNERQTK